MISGEIIGGLLVVLVGAPLVKLLDVWFGKRKQSADTESVTVKTALELNEGLARHVGALEATVATLRRDVAALERRERLRNRRDAKHEAWDYLVVSRARDRGIDLPDPPPLGGDGDDAGERTRAEDYGLPGATDGDRRGGLN